MCSKKATKIEESNNKRLQSLNERLNEFQLKKQLVRSSLNNLDSSKKSKKIVFEDDDDDMEIKQMPVTKSVISVSKDEKSTNFETVARKKMKLIDSESEEETRTENENIHKMFESKINLDQKKANKLIYLKTKFSNDDRRFKIDERFIENEENSADEETESDENESSSSTDDDQDASAPQEVSLNDDNEDSKPTKTNKKQLKQETQNSLKILQEITGKQILKPINIEAGESSQTTKRNTTLRNKPIVRYDPTKQDHKKFEINEEETSADVNVKVKVKSKKDESPLTKEKVEQRIVEDKSKFVQIEPNLKDLFSSSDVFKFKFAKDESDNDAESDRDDELNHNNNNTNKLETGLKRVAGSFKRSKYSSEEEETESDEDDFGDDIDNTDSNNRNLVNVRSKETKERVLVNEVKSFLPDFEHDKELKDALKYFCSKEESLEKFRKEWATKRETLVEECKKKNKRMIRVKKIKDNQKLLPWKSGNRRKSSKMAPNKRWKKTT